MNDLRFYNGNPNLKRAGEAVNYEDWQIEEIKKCIKDPIYFAEKYYKIVQLDKGLTNIELYDYQKKALRILNDHRYTIFLQCRQSGKTTTIAIDILHHILFNSHQTVAILANKGATAREILARIKLAYENLPHWLQQGVEEWNKGSIALENGSRVLASTTSSTAIRGMSAQYVLIDECAFIENWDEFYKSVYPVITAGQKTKIRLISSANGKNHFYYLWTGALSRKNNFYPFEIKWYDVPGRDDKWKKETIANIGETAFRQEYENEFLGIENSIISSGEISILEGKLKEPINVANGVRIFEKPEKGSIYILSADCGYGVGGDDSAFSIIKVFDNATKFKQVAAFNYNMIDAYSYANLIDKFSTEYNNAYVLVENNDIGKTVLHELNFNLENENIISYNENSINNVNLGIRTTKKTKREGIAILKKLIETEKIEILDKETLIQLSGFVRTGSSFSAAEGYKDDLVMSLVLFSYFVSTKMFSDLFDKTASEIISSDEDEDNGFHIMLSQDNEIET